ncbi:hypothetical protein EV361DRAFT_940792 [Lentinula raphanica]|nr:hypothetical protein EV361DRAFT_940792 [Lentinula raphanica]
MGGNLIITIFNVIQVAGFVGAFVIMLTALFSRSLHRLSTWYLVLSSMAVYSFSMLLLAMAHGQTGPEPHFALCLVQSALAYACPIWLLSAAFAFALQFHLMMLYYAKQYSGLIHRDSKWIPLSTVILFVVLMATFLAIGSVKPEIVQRSPQQFYCHFSDKIGSYTVIGFDVVFGIAAVICEFKTGVLLYRHWKQRNELYRQSNGQVAIGVMIRLVGFSLLSLLSVATSVVYVLPITMRGKQYFVIYNAFLSNIAGPIAMGLNMSIVRSWIFWKKDIAVEVRVEQDQC